MKAHEKKWTHESPCRNKKISHAQNIRRERQKHGTTYPLAFHSIHHISTHMHFSIMVVWLAYSLGPIFDFAKYLRQVCLSFSPYLELHQKAFRSRRKKAYKRPWWGYKHFWANESVIRGTCFYFWKLLKTSGRNLEQGMGKWCFMNRSISQPPKTRRRPKAPWRLR